MTTLERAIEIAVQAHRGQKDRAGASYILHPLRVMFRTHTETERIVAILHDVVEDSDWTLDRLRQEGFTDEILSAVDSLTRRSEETYEQFIERISLNPLAVRVKLADLEDNMDLRRYHAVNQAGQDRLERYHRAWIRLTGGK